MKLAAIGVALAVAGATADARPGAVAYVADPSDAELAAYIDGRGHGGVSDGSLGMVVRGSSIAVPLAPLASVRGSVLWGEARGDVEDAVVIALAQLDRATTLPKVVVVHGVRDEHVRDRLRMRTRAAHSRIVFEMPSQMYVETFEPSVVTLPPPSPGRDPAPVWPAFALLALAGAIAFRASRAPRAL
jgi:hypothetical protein